MMRRRNDSGAVALEVALLMPVFLMVVALIVVAGVRTLYAGLAENEARRAARMASIHTTSSTSSPYPATAAVCAQAGLPIPGATYNAATGCSVTNDMNPLNASPGEGDLVTVELTYGIPMLQAFVGWVPGSSLDAVATVTVRASVIRE
jgi:Flp pilus assembly protein TadG